MNHRKVEHSSTFAERQRQALLDLSLRSARKNVTAKCPLCLREGEVIRSHLARHMRALALFVLPRGVSDIAGGEKSDELRLCADAANDTSDDTRALDQGESDHSGSYKESLFSDAVMEEHILPPKKKEKGKERVFGTLRDYDTVFLVDDSDSMYGPRWDTTKHVLAKIASIAVLHDRDGVHIRFFNEYLEDVERLHLDSADKVMSIFGKVEPFGSTPTADVLERELLDHIYEYRSNRHKKGLNLIILTDGEPDTGQDVAGVIARFAKNLKELEAPLRPVGIQFVQIGGDEKAAEFLRTLKNDLQQRYALDRDVSAHDYTSSSRLTSTDC